MYHNRGQMTIFIVVGLVVILIAALAMLMTKSVTEETTNPEILPIKTYVESCLDQVGNDAIFFNSMQGGYYSTPSPKEFFSFIEIPAYWVAGTNNVPSIETIEDELVKYVKVNLPKCLDGFSAFDDEGFTITTGELGGYAEISDSIDYEIDYPISIEREGTIVHLEDFSVKVEIDFRAKHQLILKIMEKQEQTPDSIPLGFLTNLAYENDFQFETVMLDEKTVMFTLIFDEEINKGQPLVYLYANKYDWSDLSSQDKVDIHTIPEFVIDAPKTLRYKVNATGNDLTFFAYTDLFDIDPTSGVIEFDTSYILNGRRYILIKAEDPEGNRDFEYMRLTIDYPQLVPIIEPIGELTAYVGQEFTYQVDAIDPTGEYLGFLDDTSLFDIDPATGEIKFTPTMIGTYAIKITAVNAEGHSFELMRLDIR